MLEYTLMHANETVAVVKRETNSAEILLPEKLPFGLRVEPLDYIVFMDWLQRRVNNLQRSYMNKVYLARKVGRETVNILRDSCAVSFTDKFWIKRSDINATWAELQKLRDQNQELANVALSGDTANLDWEAVMRGYTSLFTTKGAFPKAILNGSMLKLSGTQEREWVASVLGKALGLPVQEAEIKNPSVSGNRDKNGSREINSFTSNSRQQHFHEDVTITYLYPETDDTLVEIKLFTSENISLVHASELFPSLEFAEAHREGQHHRYFYDRLPNDKFKREFERVLILNWLISNHDMHGENFGCLYDPETFELTGIAPSFDHNSADFDGTIAELDVPEIVKPAIKFHGDVISKIKSGTVEKVLNDIKDWLTPEQKNGVRKAARDLTELFEGAL